MISYLKFYGKYTFFWFFFFISLKFLLIYYHFQAFSAYPITDLGLVFVSGSVLDISLTAYILIPPTLLFIFAPWINPRVVSKSLAIYSLLLLLLISFLVIIDLEIFRWWGHRADKTIFRYLQVPKEILATISVAPVSLLLSVYLLIFSLFYLLYKKLINDHSLKKPEKKTYHVLFILLIGGFLIIPIRGGIQQIPVNQSSVYFSNYNILNLASINVGWNFLSSLISKNSKLETPYSFEELKNPEELVNDQLLFSSPFSSDKVLNQERPNVIIIVWESFTYKAITDSRNLTPNFNSYKNEGLFFDSLFATGERSDKGLIGILSGYPSQSNYSISKDPVKACKLPSITSQFKNSGYKTSFYYGGETQFANLRSYFLCSGFQNIIEESDFDKELQTAKWGVHDEYVLDRLLKDLAHEKKPFFTTLFTLSSHEPYDVPIKAIPGETNEEKFCNSIYYTDSCLAVFLNKAKKEPWWNNTLIVIVADHGHVFPGANQWPARIPDEFHIPMLWTGGALKEKGVINKTASQTDIAATILGQLGMDSEEFIYSKNILSENAPSKAYFAYNNGFGLVMPHGAFVIDNMGNNISFKNGNPDDSSIKMARAFQQLTFRDYLQK